jgi:hypothetical protein
MLDPLPTFGRFTDWPTEPLPRDEYEWLCEAEDTLHAALLRTRTSRQKRALLERVIECIEQAKKRA